MQREAVAFGGRAAAVWRKYTRRKEKRAPSLRDPRRLCRAELGQHNASLSLCAHRPLMHTYIYIHARVAGNKADRVLRTRGNCAITALALSSDTLKGASVGEKRRRVFFAFFRLTFSTCWMPDSASCRSEMAISRALL